MLVEPPLPLPTSSPQPLAAEPSWSRSTSGWDAPRARIISIEGLWGAGKSSLGAALAHSLTALGFDATVVHYGPRSGVHAALSELLERRPLRSRAGVGGYARPGHATVDALLRLCREADNHRYYRQVARAHQVVIVDHGIYAKLAYCLTVLAEQHPDAEPAALLAQLRACTEPWWLHPDVALHLDTPWPLARERAIARGYGGGDPAAVERLLFMPAMARHLRTVLDQRDLHVRRIHVGLRRPEQVAADATTLIRTLLRVPDPQEVSV